MSDTPPPNAQCITDSSAKADSLCLEPCKYHGKNTDSRYILISLSLTSKTEKTVHLL